MWELREKKTRLQVFIPVSQEQTYGAIWGYIALTKTGQVKITKTQIRLEFFNDSVLLSLCTTKRSLNVLVLADMSGAQ